MEYKMSLVVKALPLAALAMLLVIAVYTDLRYGKIYNKLTFPCMAAGLALGFLGNGLFPEYGLKGLLQSLAGIGVVLGLYLLSFSKGIAGGDIKLMMAVGSLVGLRLTIWAILFSAAIGGILALIVMARYRTVRSTAKNLATHAYLKVVLRAPVELAGGSRANWFRYSPAIALGTLLTLLIR